MAQFDSQEGKTISNVEAASETVPTIISTSATTSASLAGLLAGPSKPSDTKVPKRLSDELAEWFRKGSSSSEIKFILDLYPFLLENKNFDATSIGRLDAAPTTLHLNHSRQQRRPRRCGSLPR